MISITIKDRYRIEREIGKGGMGTIYQGHDTALKRNIAIKMLTGTKFRESSPYIVMEYEESVNMDEQTLT